MVSKLNQKNKLFHTLIHVIFILFSLACIIPIILVISISFMHESDIFTTGYSLIPTHLTLNAYIAIFGNAKQLIASYMVTIGVTITGTVGGLWLTATIAYVLSRRDYRFRKQLTIFVFFTMVFSGGMVPTYILIAKWLHLKDTYFVLIFPGLLNAFYIFLMRGFLQNIPVSLIEAAKIDGASELRVFLQIIIPLSKPALATVGLFIGFFYWNDWMTSFLYINSDSKIMLQYLLVKIMNSLEFLNSAFALSMGVQITDAPTYSARMAMCVLAAGPMLMVFPFFQKYFVKGITLGSVKG